MADHIDAFTINAEKLGNQRRMDAAIEKVNALTLEQAHAMLTYLVFNEPSIFNYILASYESHKQC